MKNDDEQYSLWYVSKYVFFFSILFSRLLKVENKIWIVKYLLVVQPTSDQKIV